MIIKGNEKLPAKYTSADIHAASCHVTRILWLAGVDHVTRFPAFWLAVVDHVTRFPVFWLAGVDHRISSCSQDIGLPHIKLLAFTRYSYNTAYNTTLVLYNVSCTVCVPLWPIQLTACSMYLYYIVR